jgi:hypothetical protein
LQLYHAVSVQIVRAVIEQCNALSACGIPYGAFTAEVDEVVFQLVTDSIFIVIDLAVSSAIEYRCGVEARFIVLLRGIRIVVAGIFDRTAE